MGRAGVEPQEEKFLHIRFGREAWECHGPSTEERFSIFLKQEEFVLTEKGYVSTKEEWKGWVAEISAFGTSNTRRFSPPGIGV